MNTQKNARKTPSRSALNKRDIRIEAERRRQNDILCASLMKVIVQNDYLCGEVARYWLGKHGLLTVDAKETNDNFLRRYPQFA